MQMSVHIPSSAEVKLLLSRLERSTAPDDEELLSMLASPSVTSGLDHWALWALICLARHLERQRWVGYIVETRLNGDLQQIGTGGALGHPEGRPQQGPVPDEPDWEYYFHGCGCCLTNRREGTSIDVDFDREGATEAVDPFFFSNFLSSLRTPELPERLLRRSAPFENAWHAEIPVLEASGCLTREHRTRLTPLGRDIAETLRPVAERLHALVDWGTRDSRRKAVLGVLALGDPILAEQVASAGNEVLTLPAPIIDACNSMRSRRALRLHAAVEESQEQKIPEFVALASMGPEFSRGLVTRALFRNPVDGIANTALEVLSAWNDPDLLELLTRLVIQRHSEIGFISRFRRMLQTTAETNDLLPRGYQIVHATIALLQRVARMSLEPSLKETILTLMENVSGANAGEAALVTYLLDPQAGFRAIESALSDRVPAAYQDAVVACVLIGSAQARALLERALHNPNQQIQHNAACGLSHFSDPGASQLTREWNRRNDGIDQPFGQEVTIGERTIEAYTFQDISHANMDMFFASALDRMRKKFGPLLSVNS